MTVKATSGAYQNPDTFAAKGLIWGGNLSVLVSLLGTPYFPSVQGGILFLEDVAEPAYRIERAFLQLAYAGVLTSQSAVVLGHFTGSERGAGIGASFVYYLLRNHTGLLSLAPFYENAYVYAGGKYRAHSGAGATLSYKLWRFPLPLGINYTHNLQDGGNLVGFVIGGAF